jgi:enoyl-CoA hydratase/carnithine racemase
MIASAAMSDAVRYAPGPIGVITLDRPDNRNSMTPELLDAFQVAVAAARADASARCIVITGTGACFSSGADFKSLFGRAPGAPESAPPSGPAPARPGLQRTDGPHRAPHERSYAMYAPFLSVLDIEVPVIAACNGHAVGGGFGLALLCDLRIGAIGSTYGANFARLGLAPGMAISYLLPRLVGVSRAAELLFTGRLIKGAEAERIGILSSAVEAAEVLPRALELAGAIAAAAPLAVRATKRTFYRGLGWQVRDAALSEAFAQAESLATADAAEGIAALLAKRDPTFTGS